MKITYNNEKASLLALKALNLEPNEYSLIGKTIGVPGGSVFSEYFMSSFKSIVNIKIYGSLIEALADLKAGYVDAVFGPSEALDIWKKAHGDGQYNMIADPIEVETQHFITTQTGQGQLAN